MSTKKAVDDINLEKVSGGRTLPEDWEKIAEQLKPMLLKTYGNLTYEQACAEVDKNYPDEDDRMIIKEYIKQFYPQFQEQ